MKRGRGHPRAYLLPSPVGKATDPEETFRPAVCPRSKVSLGHNHIPILDEYHHVICLSLSYSTGPDAFQILTWGRGASQSAHQTICVHAWRGQAQLYRCILIVCSSIMAGSQAVSMPRWVHANSLCDLECVLQALAHLKRSTETAWHDQLYSYAAVLSEKKNTRRLAYEQKELNVRAQTFNPHRRQALKGIAFLCANVSRKRFPG